MKTAKKPARKGRKAANTFLPIPNQEFHTTSDSSPSSRSEAAMGGLKTSGPEGLDRESAEFYQALCALYDRSKIHPVIAVHAVELFTQSIKRAERARLGVPNPEDSRVQP